MTKAIEQPVTREDLTLALLESLSNPVLVENAHIYLDQIYAIPVHKNTLVQEMRLVRFAVGLIDYGSRIVATSPIFGEFQKLLGPFMVSISDLDFEETQRPTKQLQESIDLLESSITGDTSRVLHLEIFHNAEYKRGIKAVCKKLQGLLVRRD